MAEDDIEKPLKRKVQAELMGRLLSETEAMEEQSGINVSNLIRQGLVRLSHEFRQTGRITIEPLPEEAAA
jgi:hypothetical protein